MALTEFLTARLDEDEAIARAAIELAPLPWRKSYGEDGDDRWLDIHGDGGTSVVETESGANGPGLEVAEHIFHHDPARVLREVEAKRRIIGEMVPIFDALEVLHEQEGQAATLPGHSDHASGACCCMPEGHAEEQLLKLLALPYANHPDYQEGWRP